MGAEMSLHEDKNAAERRQLTKEIEYELFKDKTPAQVQMQIAKRKNLIKILQPMEHRND